MWKGKDEKSQKGDEIMHFYCGGHWDAEIFFDKTIQKYSETYLLFF
jgi:hypothetical protein